MYTDVKLSVAGLTLNQISFIEKNNLYQVKKKAEIIKHKVCAEAERIKEIKILYGSRVHFSDASIN